MLDNIEAVKNVFKCADEIIQTKPELLTMDGDEIFDELDDGTDGMMHNRWGVLTRVKMQKLKVMDKINNKIVIDFLLGVEERKLLCEYIGFILQYEFEMSLLDILLDSYKLNVHNKILLFVEECIKYEKECFIERIDDILEIISTICSNTNKVRFINNYSELVVKQKQEDIVFQKYFYEYSVDLEQVVEQIGRLLFLYRSVDAKKWLDILIKKESNIYKKMSIKYIERSLYIDITLFEKNFSELEKFCKDVELWKELIPVYIHYMTSESEKKYINEVKKHLIDIKYSDIYQKRICIQELEYKVEESKDCMEVMDNILRISYEKDNQILQCIDQYFEKLFEKDCLEAM